MSIEFSVKFRVGKGIAFVIVNGFLLQYAPIVRLLDRSDFPRVIVKWTKMMTRAVKLDELFTACPNCFFIETENEKKKGFSVGFSFLLSQPSKLFSQTEKRNKANFVGKSRVIHTIAIILQKGSLF